MEDPNDRNLVAEVSTKEVKVYGSGDKTIMMVDCGIKYNQIRCFLQRGVKVKVVPWDYDFAKDYNEFDGLFLSNGPGDPVMASTTVNNLKVCVVYYFGYQHNCTNLNSSDCLKKKKPTLLPSPFLVFVWAINCWD